MEEDILYNSPTVMSHEDKNVTKWAKMSQLKVELSKFCRTKKQKSKSCIIKSGVVKILSNKETKKQKV